MDFAKGTLAEHRTLDFLVCQLFVALEDDMANFHLRLLINIDVEDDFVLTRHVVALDNLDFSILKSLVIKVFLSQDFGAVYHVWRNLCTFHDAELRLHVLTLRLLQAIIVDGTDSWTGGQMDAEVYLRPHQ